MPESRLERTAHGLVPQGDGWFVVGLRDAEWRHAEGRGAVCAALDDFEGERRPLQMGVNPWVLMPGEPMSVYHWEADQEDFLVVAGEAVLVVEGQERPLHTWDLVHCPPHTGHVIVGAGEGPCVVIAIGARQHADGPDWIGFPADAAAARHGASAAQDTMDPGEVYGPLPGREPTAYREGWLPDLG